MATEPKMMQIGLDEAEKLIDTIDISLDRLMGRPDDLDEEAGDRQARIDSLRAIRERLNRFMVDAFFAR